MTFKFVLAAGSALALAATAMPAAAQQTGGIAPIAQFTPRDSASQTKLDFTPWDEALRWFVLRMGQSLRESASQPEPAAGSRIVYGHESRYRLEGNRVAFNYMTDEVRTALSDYRKDLEELPSRVDLTSLPRNEQLAFWLNLHNVAIIDQIAQAYPVGSPSEVRVGDSGLPLDETPFITVAGQKLSPKDIRTRIVYPNWKDPKVVYGFWRGEIGGPSIAREAFTGVGVGDQLDELAREFVNSLRGTQKQGDTLVVSQLYLEAKPTHFSNWTNDLRNHVAKYADDEVKQTLAATSGVEARTWDADIADLNKGERQPIYSQVVSNDRLVTGVQMDGAVARLLTERQTKFEKIRRENGGIGWVTVMPSTTETEGSSAEVE